MRDETINGFLERLAARRPAPGGGASAALHAAQGAALLGMVARYTTGAKYAEHREAIERIITATDELRAAALQLARDDATAFAAVADAYRLPEDTEEAKTARSAAIATALVGAAWPPSEVIGVAEQLVTAAEGLLPVGSRSVLSDIAAAVEAARAAATTARVNIEANLRGITDDRARAELTEVAAEVDGIAARAERVTATVRGELTA
ncbi:cyclodeaminase/cyclohydrolase family protein [Streptantibioticus rubrisoli]|uniref:Cyclodeaminase/cyclohydrolase family protein n=1 Tax=Streptantibioticus rubrisoli TaxID=1387313 RepID=A0ABT1PBA8_9ACTN|nr:cyclodeaminase/cyclohydrolase family protein [Streptantibioticus rubrisoli]MCQ4041595.1 cyclodeaminase/cyclohydrolase family protein [Streptantibioticus rubrisoli]